MILLSLYLSPLSNCTYWPNRKWLRRHLYYTGSGPAAILTPVYWPCITSIAKCVSPGQIMCLLVQLLSAILPQILNIFGVITLLVSLVFLPYVPCIPEVRGPGCTGAAILVSGIGFI